MGRDQMMRDWTKPWAQVSLVDARGPQVVVLSSDAKSMSGDIPFNSTLIVSALEWRCKGGNLKMLHEPVIHAIQRRVPIRGISGPIGFHFRSLPLQMRKNHSEIRSFRMKDRLNSYQQMRPKHITRTDY